MRDRDVAKRIHYFHSSGKRSVALLLYPEEIHDRAQIKGLIGMAEGSKPDFLFVGGSLVGSEKIYECIASIKSLSVEIPVVLFPGSAMQLTENADAVLFLSLISGRNADLLIGQHVLSAPVLARTNLEVLPTGYMLVDSGGVTSVNYISQTLPLPHNKPELAIATALAGT